MKNQRWPFRDRRTRGRPGKRAYSLISISALAAAGVMIVTSAIPASALRYHSQASIGTYSNYGGLGYLTTNCLYQPDDGTDSVTQEMWDVSADSQYWVEAGQVSGTDPINNHAYYGREWFWGDSRPNGGSYHEHFTGGAGSGTFKIELEWLGGNEWGISEDGKTGTSTNQPQSIAVNAAVAAGTEYSASGPAGIADQANFHTLQYKDASDSKWHAWGSYGAITAHAWISASWHPSLSEVDWNIPCTNALRRLPAIRRVQLTTGKAGEAIPAVVERELRTVELSAAAHDGDANPAQLRAVATTESLGSRDATPGDRVTTGLRQVVYLVVMKGNFAARTLSPKGGGTVKGHYLTLTLNPETFQTIDAGVSDQAPPTALGRLGTVSNLLSLRN